MPMGRIRRSGLGPFWLPIALGLLLAAFVVPSAGAAERVAIHAAPDRLEFLFPGWTGWRMHRSGDRVRLRFSRRLPFGPAPSLPPWVRRLRDGPGWVRLRLAPGTRLRRRRFGGRLVLTASGPKVGRAPVLSGREGPDRIPPLAPGRADRANRAAAARARASAVVSAPGPEGATPAGSASTHPAASPPAQAAAARAMSTPAATGGGTPPAPSRTAAGSPPGGEANGTRLAGPAPAGSAPAGSAASGAEAAGIAQAPSGAAVATPLYPGASAAGPVALAAQVASGAATGGTMAGEGDAPKAILVPFEPGVGAGAFRRGRHALVVFDAVRPIDLAPLRGIPIFGTARVRLLASGTEIVLRLPSGRRLGLRRRRGGWEIRLLAAATRAPQAIIHPLAGKGAMRFVAPAPGGVVSLLDPLTGLPLLVGTERGPGARLPIGRRAPQVLLLRSWQGVVAMALSDHLRMRAEHGGFRLTLAGGALAISLGGPDAAGLADAALLTRRFRFPALPRAALTARMRAELRAAARLPPLARGRALRRAAQSMIALGMGAEADGVLRLAATEDPREAASATHAGLAAIAALLAGRPGAAGGIEDPRLSGSDEVGLWRAALAARRDPKSAAAAQLFAATAPLILTYPPAMRRPLLALAAETMIRAGEPDAAARLIARRPNDPRLALARGMLEAARGKTAAALAILDRLGAGPDRLIRFRAARRAIALRLRTGAIAPAAAAEALDRLRDAWRGGPRELALIQTLAGLRAGLGQFDRALGLLRGAIADFPNARPALRARMRAIFAAALVDPRLDKLSALRFVALLRDNADLLPGGAAGDAVAARLADKLEALDLPDQAGPVLARLMRAAPGAGARAGFGARLAALRLRRGDPAGAQRALTRSAGPGLTPALAQSRAILAARIAAAEGHGTEALATLAALDAQPADLAAAGIAERDGDWPAASAALARAVARAVPAAGALDPGQQRLLLRLAAARVRAGDMAGLAALRDQAGRIASGPLADMFRLLTAPPGPGVGTTVGGETMAALAARFGAALKAVR